MEERNSRSLLATGTCWRIWGYGPRVWGAARSCLKVVGLDFHARSCPDPDSDQFWRYFGFDLVTGQGRLSTNSSMNDFWVVYAWILTSFVKTETDLLVLSMKYLAAGILSNILLLEHQSTPSCWLIIRLSTDLWGSPLPEIIVLGWRYSVLLLKLMTCFALTTISNAAAYKFYYLYCRLWRHWVILPLISLHVRIFEHSTHRAATWTFANLFKGNPQLDLQQVCCFCKIIPYMILILIGLQGGQFDT